MINKIQDEIEKLEDEEKKADEIPFQGLTPMGQYGTIPYNRKRIMNEREKLKKEIKEIVRKQIETNNENNWVSDIYPIDSDILAYAYDYVPIKILKRIIKNNKNERH